MQASCSFGPLPGFGTGDTSSDPYDTPSAVGIDTPHARLIAQPSNGSSLSSQLPPTAPTPAPDWPLLLTESGDLLIQPPTGAYHYQSDAQG